jgi:hypothetical protein
LKPSVRPSTHFFLRLAVAIVVTGAITTVRTSRPLSTITKRRDSRNVGRLPSRAVRIHVVRARHRQTGVAGSFRPGTPRPWTRHTLADTGVFPNFDVGPSGEEIVAFLSATDPQTTNHVTVLLNFGEEIRRREESR